MLRVSEVQTLSCKFSYAPGMPGWVQCIVRATLRRNDRGQARFYLVPVYPIRAKFEGAALTRDEARAVAHTLVACVEARLERTFRLSIKGHVLSRANCFKKEK